MEVLHGMMDQIERQRLSKMMDEMPDNVTIQQRYIGLHSVLHADKTLGQTFIHCMFV